MKKYFETVTTRTQKWYRILEETASGEYEVIEKNANEEQIKGLTEAFDEHSVMAAIHSGGSVIKVGKSNYIVDSKLDGEAAIAATKAFI